MKISIVPRAAQWFEEEVGLPEGCGIRFKARLYGTSQIMKGYALGFEPNQPSPDTQTVLRTDHGLLLFIEDDDLWFFDGHDLLIDFDEDLKEPKYIYQLPTDQQ
ncbi:HesB/YadR/YfhF family protein [Ignavigranum ruoffiae]|uniref:HesB/YadR/YfhF family protein n=1 Tax=Ignavigranum ruoffiae TaxID=89093 RepID=UPI0024AE5D21|nr:iron-sulfur cluster biosynthesis protein [Ignavigranum ruoffiae]